MYREMVRVVKVYYYRQFYKHTSQQIERIPAQQTYWIVDQAKMCHSLF